MKQAEVRELSTKELEENLKQQKGEYTRLKLSHAVTQLENPLVIKRTRRLIARIETELRRRELEQVNN